MAGEIDSPDRSIRAEQPILRPSRQLRPRPTAIGRCDCDAPSPPARPSASSPTTPSRPAPGSASSSSRSSAAAAPYALWGAYFPLMLAAAAATARPHERLSAFNAGIGVAGVAVHFKAWPWSLHGGVPMLDEAEGLSEEQLPAYNAVLWFWLVCSALSLPAANRPRLAALRRSPACSTSRSCSPRPTTTSAGRASRRSSSRSAGARRCAELSAGGALAGRRRGRAQPQLRQPRRGGGNRARRAAADAPLGGTHRDPRCCRGCSTARRATSSRRPSSSRASTPSSTPTLLRRSTRAATRSPTTPGATSSGTS